MKTSLKVAQVGPYAKSTVAFLVGLIAFGLNLLSHGKWNMQDTIALVAWIGGTLGVYGVPNKANVEVGGQ